MNLLHCLHDTSGSLHVSDFSRAYRCDFTEASRCILTYAPGTRTFAPTFSMEDAFQTSHRRRDRHASLAEPRRALTERVRFQSEIGGTATATIGAWSANLGDIVRVKSTSPILATYCFPIVQRVLLSIRGDTSTAFSAALDSPFSFLLLILLNFTTSDYPQETIVTCTSHRLRPSAHIETQLQRHSKARCWTATH
jgi:hypothetical protein